MIDPVLNRSAISSLLRLLAQRKFLQLDQELVWEVEVWAVLENGDGSSLVREMKDGLPVDGGIWRRGESDIVLQRSFVVYIVAHCILASNIC